MKIKESKLAKLNGKKTVIVGMALMLLSVAPGLASIPNVLMPMLDEPFQVMLPSDVGSEKLQYEFGWSGIPAAKAEWVAERSQINGNEVFSVKAKARTNRAVDLLWKMRDEAEALFLADPIRPQHFRMKQKENDLRRLTTLDFDHERGMIEVKRDEKKSHKRKNTEKSEPLLGRYDPISAAFAFRGLDLKEGEVVPVEIFAGRSVYRLDVKVEGRETVEVEAGTFKAIVLVPSVYNLSKNETHDKVKTIKLWVSDDPRRLVLKVESEVFIGSVYAELVKIS